MTSAAARLSPQTCFRLPHCLGRFAPCGFSRPPALRRADYRLPPVIVMPLWIVLLLPVMVMASGESSRSTSASVVFYLLVLLVYIGKRDSSRTFISLLYIVLLGILRLLIIPAFGEILHPTSSSGGASRSLSSTRSRWNVCAAARKAGKRTAAASMPASRQRSLAGIQWLLYVGRAAAEEPDDNGKRYAVSSRASPSAHCILFAPNPTGEMNGQTPAFEEPSVWCAAP